MRPISLALRGSISVGLALVGAITSIHHDGRSVLSLGLQSAPAFAACGITGSQFDGYYVPITNLDSIQASITTDSSSSTCDTNNVYGNSYWVMVAGPSGCGGQTYAQDGWLTGQKGYSSPHVFTEVNNVGTCDQGPIIFGSITGTHLFETTMFNGYPYVQYADFYEDGAEITSATTDWSAGDDGEIFTENHTQPAHIGTVNYTGAEYCVLNGQTTCTPNTTFGVGNANNGSPDNPTGCYSQTGPASFETYDC